MLACLLAVCACGDGSLGEARLTWQTPDDRDSRSRRIDTWAFMGGDGSRFAPDGSLVHIEFPLEDGLRGHIEFDIADDPGRRPTLHYAETRGQRVVFEGNATRGAISVAARSSRACGCVGGVFDLEFVDPGSDGKVGTDDDRRRRLERGSYQGEDSTCPQLTLPEERQEEGVILRVQSGCEVGKDPRTTFRKQRPGPPLAGRGGRDVVMRPRSRSRSSVLVVVAQPYRDPYVPDTAQGGCSCTGDRTYNRSSGCSADDDSADNGGGCSADDDSADNGGGCSADNDSADNGGGCSADNDSADNGGGCSSDDDSADSGSGGCEGDSIAATRTRAGSARVCQFRRPRRGLISGTAQNYLLITAAASVQWFRGRRRRWPRS